VSGIERANAAYLVGPKGLVEGGGARGGGACWGQPRHLQVIRGPAAESGGACGARSNETPRARGRPPPGRGGGRAAGDAVRRHPARAGRRLLDILLVRLKGL
jgi:hypothetical protein